MLPDRKNCATIDLPSVMVSYEPVEAQAPMIRTNAGWINSQDLAKYHVHCTDIVWKDHHSNRDNGNRNFFKINDTHLGSFSTKAINIWDVAKFNEAKHVPEKIHGISIYVDYTKVQALADGKHLIAMKFHYADAPGCLALHLINLDIVKKFTFSFYNREIFGNENERLVSLTALPNSERKNLVIILSSYFLYLYEIEISRNKITRKDYLRLPGNVSYYSDFQPSPDGQYLSVRYAEHHNPETCFRMLIDCRQGKLKLIRTLEEHYQGCSLEQRWVNGLWLYYGVDAHLCAYDPSNDVLFQNLLCGPVVFTRQNLFNFSTHPGIFCMVNNSAQFVSIAIATPFQVELTQALTHIPQPVIQLIANYVGLFAKPRQPIAPLCLPVAVRQAIHDFIEENERLCRDKAKPWDADQQLASSRLACVRQLLVFIDLHHQNFSSNNNILNQWIKHFFADAPKKTVSADPLKIARDKQIKSDLANLRKDQKLNCLLALINTPKVIKYICENSKQITIRAR